MNKALRNKLDINQADIRPGSPKNDLSKYKVF